MLPSYSFLNPQVLEQSSTPRVCLIILVKWISDLDYLVCLPVLLMEKEIPPVTS